MSVLVDTSIWSLALRRARSTRPEIEMLSNLILDGLVKIIGPVRQELLSGITSNQQFQSLKSELENFPDTPLYTADYVLAASYFNQCRKKGVQGSHIDFLICAAAVNNEFRIHTADKDFRQYEKIIPIQLFAS